MTTTTTGATDATGAAGAYAPKPGAAPLGRMIAAQAALETKMLLRNGEQLLLTVIIPTLLLVLFSAVDVVDTGTGASVDFLAPGILALAVMSTAFTGQAIATGFERRYGVLKRLAASPLPRWGLMTAKTLSVLVTEVLQIALLTLIAFALGWSPHGNPAAVLLLLLLGTAAFSGLGLLMAGTLKAEATLAAANLVFLLLLVGGGVIVPLDRFPDAAQSVLGLLPISALADGLRDVLKDGAGTPWGDLGVLAVWAVAGLAAAGRFFRWE
ncbi:ABC transporter permease [Streptomyces olivaceus]|uniref:ABC transporter permease n=2 Tax=Streptomyces TaxID=1883 RepID=A0ABS7W9T5_STROV|nr:ABC transporter permease [Streptomyces olivaceus]MBZ6089495.1 ABC transporter permease [Streptomyces olivaceus]MBZ6099917.1 ABC transporter permease [Streptomyces olivaceus]MBZ6113846.1 ABC transporter permease [Streptomyces olivaceus]MBZ6118038.1 ABC transporter permease [Streptomyces olivaceus]